MFDFGIGGAILGGLALGAGKAFMGDWMNRRSERRTFADNERLSWEMWKAQNEYNHPAAQMQRYREAGLNPNLIYGQMPMSPGPAMVKSVGKPADVDFNPNLANELEGSRLNNALTRAEIANKIQQQKINDVAMESTRMATKLAQQKLAIDARQSLDAHNESLVRQSALAQQIQKVANETSLTDSIYDLFGGEKKGPNRGSAIKNTIGFAADLAKKAAAAYFFRYI